MENASRALLMAAGVLIGILILSLAVYLYVDFSDISNQMYEEMELNQINQFNVQFLQYEGKDNVTIYDVITVTNLARNNNDSKDLTQNSVGNDYITVVMNNKRGKTINQMEKQTDAKLNDLLQEDIAQNGELPTYSCKVTISDITRLVKKITFEEK